MSFKIPLNLNGARGLIAAVIGMAVKDLQSKNMGLVRDAQAYFRSEWYQHHLECLGLEPSLLPKKCRHSQ